MKYLITVLALLISFTGYSQLGDRLIGGTYLPFTGSGSINILVDQHSDVKVTSTWDTTLLFKGIDTVFHEHAFVSKSNKKSSFGSCAVVHGPAGCDYNWSDDDLICTVCLRNLNVRESRSSITIKKVDPYQEAKDRLNKIKK